jgi:hypothetical protein
MFAEEAPFSKIAWKNSNHARHRPMFPKTNNDAIHVNPWQHLPTSRRCNSLALFCRITLEIFSLRQFIQVSLQSAYGLRHEGFEANCASCKGKEAPMIEFRWVVILTLWTLLIGPVFDFTQSAPSAPSARAKNVPPAKVKKSH